MKPLRPLAPSAFRDLATDPVTPRSRPSRGWLLCLALLLPCGLSSVPAGADEDRWTVDVEAVQISLSGHDRLVLLDRAGDAGGTPDGERRLNAGDTFANRLEVRRAGRRWDFGVNFFWYTVSQLVPPASGAATAPGDRRTFVVGGGEVVSTSPSESLYFERLEDTTVEMWTADVIASRPIRSGPRGRLNLLFGLRAADFDNDYHAVAGVGEIGGLRLDASSNYDRMHGPLIGLAGSLERGRHRFDGYLSQSIVFGDVELSSSMREFEGPPSLVLADVPNVVGQVSFVSVVSESVPMTDLRLRWRYRISDNFALGLGAFGLVWWNLSVPPGVEAGSTIETRDENTIRAFGGSAGLTVTF